MPKVYPSYRLMVGLTLGVGVGVAVWLTVVVNQWELARRQQRFQRQIENLTTALQRSLNRYTDVLAFLGDYYAVQSPAIDRATFAAFVQRSLQNHPGIQALEWAPLVTDQERSAYEHRLKAEGYLGFQITELGRDQRLGQAGGRPEYVPVTYVEPWVGNESALGYDLASDPIRAAAIAQARETGTLQATGRIRLVQEKRNQFGFLVFQPLYQPIVAPSKNTRSQNSCGVGILPATQTAEAASPRSMCDPLIALTLRPGDQPGPSSRRVSAGESQFTGVLVGVFRISDVVEESLQGLQYEIDFSLYDRSAQGRSQFLGRYEAKQKQVTTGEAPFALNPRQLSLCPQPATCTQVLVVGQRQWTIEFTPSANYVVDTHYGAIAILIVGLLFTLGLVLFLHQLNRELEQSQSLSQLRNRFFSMASHELRTPLSTILVSSESLQLNYAALSDDQKQASIQRIYGTAKRMHQQIADLLLLTRAEVGKLDFHPELLDVEPFLQAILEELQLGITQTITVDGIAGVTRAFLDKKLLRSLVTNLLSNAAKYSPPQSEIKVSLTSDIQGLTLQIEDQGIGIPKTEHIHLGNAFFRASNVGTITGSGLGLAVVKASVELHQGAWTIASQEGKGTTITIRLPLE